MAKVDPKKLENQLKDLKKKIKELQTKSAASLKSAEAGKKAIDQSLKKIGG